MQGQIYVPPDTTGDPFRADRVARRQRRIAIAGGGVVVLALVAIVVWLVTRREVGEAAPPPLVAKLTDTDWRWPAEPTGHRRIGSILGPGTSFDRVAVNRAGVVAIGARRILGESVVIVWRDQRPRAFSLGRDNGAVTALGVDPEGVVHVGLGDGTLARIEPNDAVSNEGVVASGYSITGFAFDADSRRSALMLSGGEVRTGLRPLRRASLHTVRMPERARIRELVYSGDGDLVVAGDAGAVFVATEDGWEEQSLPTSGRVVALGVAADGEILAAQANGHVFVGSGVWDRIGQITRAPIAVGEIPGKGVVVVAGDGRVFATLGRDDFSEMPGWDPPGGAAFTHAVVAGHDVMLASPERLLAFDGATFDSSKAFEGALTHCEIFGPPSHGAPGVLPTVLRCGDGALATIEGSDLRRATHAGAPAAHIPAADFTRALEEATRRPWVWVGGELWAAKTAGELPALDRWDAATKQWQLAAPFALDEGPILAVAAAAAGDAWEVWTVSRSGDVRMGRVAPGGASGPAFELVARHAQIAAHYGGDAFTPYSVQVYALGSGRAAVVHDRRVATRVAQGEREVEPLAIPATSVMQIGAHVVAIGDDEIWRVPSIDAPRRLELPRGFGVAPASAWEQSPFHGAARGDELVLRVGERAVLRCRGDRCEAVALPEASRVERVGYTADGRLVLDEAGGTVAIVEPRGR